MVRALVTVLIKIQVWFLDSNCPSSMSKLNTPHKSFTLNLNSFDQKLKRFKVMIDLAH